MKVLSLVIGIVAWCTGVKQQRPRLVPGRMTVLACPVDRPSYETLDRRHLALLLWRQYEFPFGINILINLVQFSIFFHFFFLKDEKRFCLNKANSG